MSLAEAEAHLLAGNVQEVVLNRYKLNVLQALCVKYKLSVKPTGRRTKQSIVKRDYVLALVQYQVGLDRSHTGLPNLSPSFSGRLQWRRCRYGRP